jgi:hypothetical protein
VSLRPGSPHSFAHSFSHSSGGGKRGDAVARKDTACAEAGSRRSQGAAPTRDISSQPCLIPTPVQTSLRSRTDSLCPCFRLRPGWMRSWTRTVGPMNWRPSPTWQVLFFSFHHDGRPINWFAAQCCKVLSVWTVGAAAFKKAGFPAMCNQT